MLKLFTSILVASSALFISRASAQTTYGIGVPNNVTSLQGTWSTGAGHVLTGLNFYDPVNNSFIYPATAGQSYSFTNDGYWEQALYLYNTNPAKPNCVSAQLIWQHGTYILNPNNTLTLNIFKGDGRQQVSDRCAEKSNYVQSYDQVENMNGFEIHLDTHFNSPAYSLQLYRFDGSLAPLMYQVFNPPQMLPTQPLHEEIIGELNSS
ncbi:related to ROT1 - molecular chaperone in the endoplasmic reticulum [Moesziomyces antarcticus]|nr:related to ROT1 - molecular chaperone in the endoplasmic reticulum [Moesziomyces antarcticus]